MTDLTAVQIAKTYHMLGDTVQAQEWMDKALKNSKQYSKIETKDQDPFIVALIATKNKPDHELEYGQLQANLNRIAAEVGVNVAISEKIRCCDEDVQPLRLLFKSSSDTGSGDYQTTLVTSYLERARPLLESITTDQLFYGQVV